MDVANATLGPVGHAVQSVEQKRGALMQFASAASVKQYAYCPQTVLHDPDSQMPMSGIVVDVESEGDAVGEDVAIAVGERVAIAVGERVAIAVGEDVAIAVGEDVAIAVGEAVGIAVGEDVAGLQ